VRLGLLKTGAPPKEAAQFGTYPEMFRRLLGEDAYDYVEYAVDSGELPGQVADCQAYLVTGSACGVYDPIPWIDELKRFLNAARGRAALVGICFGHQVMAEAFGGKVIKSPKGWGVGAHAYEVRVQEPWMDGAARIRLAASHQDQVVAPPPAAEVAASSDFCAFGALAYRDQPAISLQLHPEFEPAYAAALIESRRGSRFSDEAADRALASLKEPLDRERVAGWIRNFLAGATSGGG
jgi:GMP synthase-like glutamine amidotransferase